MIRLKRLVVPLVKSSSMTPVFELHQVSKTFGSLTALHQLNLVIRQGEQVALIGPSGAGKSTLLSLLNGSLYPTQGVVRLMGQDVAQLSPCALRRVQQQVGMVYQQWHLVHNLRVIHNVNAGRLGQWPWWKALASLVWPLEVGTAVQVLDRVGIPEKIYERTDSLSGGQQQRVALARVLMQDPAAVLADEPVASVDPERSRYLMDLLSDWCRQSGKTLIVSLHAIEYVQTHFQRVLGLRAGKVMFDIPASHLTSAHTESLYHLS